MGAEARVVSKDSLTLVLVLFGGLRLLVEANGCREQSLFLLVGGAKLDNFRCSPRGFRRE